MYVNYVKCMYVYFYYINDHAKQLHFAMINMFYVGKIERHLKQRNNLHVERVTGGKYIYVCRDCLSSVGFVVFVHTEILLCVNYVYIISL